MQNQIHQLWMISVLLWAHSVPAIEYAFNNSKAQYDLKLDSGSTHVAGRLLFKCVKPRIANGTTLNLKLSFEDLQVAVDKGEDPNDEASGYNAVLNGLSPIDFEVTINKHGLVLTTNIAEVMNKFRLNLGQEKGRVIDAVITPLIAHTFFSLLPTFSLETRDRVTILAQDWNPVDAKLFARWIPFGNDAQTLHKKPTDKKQVLWGETTHVLMAKSSGDSTDSSAAITTTMVFDEQEGLIERVEVQRNESADGKIVRHLQTRFQATLSVR